MRASRGPPSPRREGHRLRRCQTPPPRRHSLRAGALARDTRRIRRLPAHALIARIACGSHGPGLSLPDPPNPRPARYTAVAATHAASGTRRRAVAHGHANASATRGGGIPPLSCPLPTAPLRGRRPVIRSSFPSVSLSPRFLPRPHRPDLQSQCLITPLPSLFAIIAKTQARMMAKGRAAL
jgi:hypothetical protein